MRRAEKGEEEGGEGYKEEGEERERVWREKIEMGTRRREKRKGGYGVRLERGRRRRERKGITLFGVDALFYAF